MAFREVQPVNALSSITLILAGNSNDSKLEHSPKALNPILSKLPGNETDVKFVLESKLLFPIRVIPSSTITVFILSLYFHHGTSI